jgi:hypothetical protein
MEFPFIVEAYTPTKSGDAVYKIQVVNNDLELTNFKDQYKNLHFKYKEIEQGPLNPEIRQQIISLIKERIETIGAVSVIQTIKEIMGLSFGVYAPEIENISSTIIKSRNYIRTKNGNDYYLSLNPEKRFIWWQTFNNKWTPILAAAALAFSAFTFFNGRSNQRQEELKTQKLQQKMQSLDSTLQNVQKLIDYLLKEKALKDTAK